MGQLGHKSPTHIRHNYTLLHYIIAIILQQILSVLRLRDKLELIFACRCPDADGIRKIILSLIYDDKL